jgi:hypothetical protein
LSGKERKKLRVLAIFVKSEFETVTIRILFFCVFFLLNPSNESGFGCATNGVKRLGKISPFGVKNCMFVCKMHFHIHYITSYTCIYIHKSQSLKIIFLNILFSMELFCSVA